MKYVSILIAAAIALSVSSSDAIAQSRDGRVIVRDRTDDDRDRTRGRTGERRERGDSDDRAARGRTGDIRVRDHGGKRRSESRGQLPDILRDRDREGDWGYGRRHESARIPAGHLPPPGECRLWYYERPPGHQPPPTSCASVRGRRYRNAVVVRSDGTTDRSIIPLPGRTNRSWEDVLFPDRSERRR